MKLTPIQERIEFTVSSIGKFEKLFWSNDKFKHVNSGLMSSLAHLESRSGNIDFDEFQRELCLVRQRYTDLGLDIRKIPLYCSLQAEYYAVYERANKFRKLRCNFLEFRRNPIESDVMYSNFIDHIKSIDEMVKLEK